MAHQLTWHISLHGTPSYILFLHWTVIFLQCVSSSYIEPHHLTLNLIILHCNNLTLHIIILLHWTSSSYIAHHLTLQSSYIEPHHLTLHIILHCTFYSYIELSSSYIETDHLTLHTILHCTFYSYIELSSSYIETDHLTLHTLLHCIFYSYIEPSSSYIEPHLLTLYLILLHCTSYSYIVIEHNGQIKPFYTRCLTFFANGGGGREKSNWGV